VSVGLLGAFVAAVAYGSATILQAVGVRRLAALPQPATLGPRVRAVWPYGAGLALDAAGFLASLVALRTLPLFLVESAVASSVAVTALLSVLVLHVALQAREVVALAAVALGLVALALAAEPGPARSPGPTIGWWLLGAAVLVAALLVVGLADRQPVRPVVVLSVAAGLGFGGVGVAARVVEVPQQWWHVVADPAFWALAAHAVLATVCYAVALARGRVTTVAALTFAAETIVPAAVGLLWLGDAVRAGWTAVALAGFVVTLAGCIALAGRAEAPESSEDEGVPLASEAQPLVVRVDHAGGGHDPGQAAPSEGPLGPEDELPG
jgi:drug/metabolite transporter (DMT)-like permease